MIKVDGLIKQHPLIARRFILILDQESIVLVRNKVKRWIHHRDTEDTKKMAQLS